MSKRKDRERAKSGSIFRDGRLWDAEEWYAAHPTREVLVARHDQQKVEVKNAIEEAQAFAKIPNRYYCTLCRKTHIKTSKAGRRDISFYLEEGASHD